MDKYVDFGKFQKELFKRTERYAENVRKIYQEHLQQIINIVKGTELKDGVPFSFAEYGYGYETTEILRKLYSRVYQEIRGDITKEWMLSNQNVDKLVKGIFGGKANENNHLLRYFQHNREAMDAFFARKTSAEELSLSQRVWKYVSPYKEELENCIDLALGEGIGANKLASKVQEYLRDPDRWYRRFRVKAGTDKDGEPVWDKIWKRRIFDRATQSYKWINDNPKNYHPGRGVYRSSYRNAQRLCRTETNIAYRSAEFERWQQLDFVVGIEIKLSNNHPVTDICDGLKGVYPKSFKWTGWHPQCRCYQVPVMATPDEMDNMIDNILSGKPPASGVKSSETIEEYPEEFQQWMRNNEERIAKAEKRGTLPYFIKDNKAYIENVQSKSNIATKTLVDYKNIPTLENTQKLIDDYYNNKNHNTSDSSELWIQGNEDKMQDVMMELFENSDFGMNANTDKLESILNSYFKNQMETSTSGGYFNINERKEESKYLFGTNTATTAAPDYEKYGYLMDRDIIKNYEAHSNGQGAAQYGELQIRFRKDKVVATFTMQDSLDSKLIPSLTTEPKLSSFGKNDGLFKAFSGQSIETTSAVDFTKKYAKRYIELQYHGKLGVDAIESIFIPADQLRRVNMTFLNSFRGKFKVYTEENGKLKEVF
ncbi:MAG: hypothetical protein LBE04_01825 [Prevotellaceae bacterium]|jgi:hypothetical protein|nr:hypothetical protein [Prevotellaceae bacterium]